MDVRVCAPLDALVEDYDVLFDIADYRLVPRINLANPSQVQ